MVSFLGFLLLLRNGQEQHLVQRLSAVSAATARFLAAQSSLRLVQMQVQNGEKHLLRAAFFVEAIAIRLEAIALN